MQAADLFNIEGHVALVTGAASGLGFAFADVLAANGAHVTLLDNDAAGLAAAVQRLADAGGKVEGAVLDAGDRNAVRAAVDAVAAKHGQIDVAFANAGISAGPGFAFGPAGELANVVPESWDRVLDINLTGVFATLQAASIHMKKRRSGRIIVTASIAGLKAETVCGYAYTATKAAVINLVRHAALELAPHNVLVTAIAPGPFHTNIAGGRLNDANVRAEFAKTVPLGRIAATDEIKGLALLLASPASSYMTGITIPIDGGSIA
jgi:NAD(P)-dependent dehydrogenase (short-subunit alcohol dehydrogenase family)